MISDENLDIRTITMGISLLDCCSESMETMRQKIFDKIAKKAEYLVETGEKIEREYGIPIIHKRIAVTPISLLAANAAGDSTALALAMEAAAKQTGVNFIGGYSALVHKGYTAGDEKVIHSLPQVLKETERVCASVNVGTTKAGINMDAVREMGEMVKAVAEATKEQDSCGCAKLVVFTNAVEDNPFMAGAFHGVGEPECVINVGVSGRV